MPSKENLGIEPLPDIDFNICAGNTLVGYATPDEVQNSMFGREPSGTHSEGRRTNPSLPQTANRRRAIWQNSASTSSKSAPCSTKYAQKLDVICSPILGHGTLIRGKISPAVPLVCRIQQHHPKRRVRCHHRHSSLERVFRSEEVIHRSRLHNRAER